MRSSSNPRPVATSTPRSRRPARRSVLQAARSSRPAWPPPTSAPRRDRPTPHTRATERRQSQDQSTRSPRLPRTTSPQLTHSPKQLPRYSYLNIANLATAHQNTSTYRACPGVSRNSDIKDVAFIHTCWRYKESTARFTSLDYESAEL